jgi:hypothetical protein
MEVMLALPSEYSRLSLSFPVYSFPLCLQVEHMEVMLALPSEDWRSDVSFLSIPSFYVYRWNTWKYCWHYPQNTRV